MITYQYPVVCRDHSPGRDKCIVETPEEKEEGEEEEEEEEVEEDQKGEGMVEVEGEEERTSRSKRSSVGLVEVWLYNSSTYSGEFRLSPRVVRSLLCSAVYVAS